MKNFYKVSNTIENGPRMDRVKSRIGSINHRIWSVIAPMLFVAFGLFGVNVEMWGASTATLNQSSNGGFGSTTGITFSISNLGSWTGAQTKWSSTYKHCAGYKVETGVHSQITWSGVASGKCVNITSVVINATVESGGTFNTGQKMKVYTSVSGSGTTKEISSSGNTSAQSVTVNGDTYLKDIGNSGYIEMYSSDQKWYIESIVITYTIDNLPTFTFEINGSTAQTTYGAVTLSFDNSTYNSGEQTKTVTGAKLSTTSATQNIYFKATPATGCQFKGWFDNSSCTGTAVSTETTYGTSLTNYTSGSTVSKTLYAKFDNKQPQTITWNQTVNNQIRGNEITLNATASSGLGVYYTASSTNGATVSISGNKITCLTAGTITITAHQDGNAQYYASSNNPTKTFTIAEHQITKNPTATSITYEQALSSSTLSGGTANVAGSWSWESPTTVPAAGTANQVAVFTPTSTVIPALKCSVSVTVAKATPDVACTVNANAHYVDDTKIDLQTAWTREGNGTITYSVLSFVESGTNNGGGTTPYVESNQYLHLQKAGTAKVKMSIAEGTNYIARNETIDVVINKKTNTLSCSWNNWFKDFYVNGEAAITISSNNDDLVNSPIKVDVKERGDVAAFRPKSVTGGPKDSVAVFCNLGIARWYVSQEENYKYLAADTVVLSARVKKATQPSCDIADGQHTTGTNVDEFSDDAPALSWSTRGIADSLYFYAKEQLAATFSTVTPRQRIDGSWSDLTAVTSLSSSFPSTPTGRKLDSTATAVSFTETGTLRRYVKDVRITRHKYFSLQDSKGKSLSTLDLTGNTLKNTKQGSFVIHYSTCADYIYVHSSYDHITINGKTDTTIVLGDKHDGNITINVVYSSPNPEDTTATLTAYTQYENQVITVHAQTEKQTPTLEWKDLYKSNPAVLPMDYEEDAAATASNGATITYSVQAGEEAFIEIAADGRSFTTKAVGTVHLTATSEETNDCISVSDTKVVQVTNKQSQTIVWGQTFTRSMKVGNEIPLNAKVKVLNKATGLLEENADRTALIGYECQEGDTVVQFFNKQGSNVTWVRIIGTGTTTLTASVGGDEDYEAASSVVRDVIVRSASSGKCDAPAIYEQDEEILFFKMDLGKPALSHDIPIDRSLGYPDTLTFIVRGESYNVLGSHFEKDIDVYESTDYGDSWTLKTTVDAQAGKTVKSGPIALSKDATNIRFKRPKGGEGYHYIESALITMRTALESEYENNTVNLGQISLDAPLNTYVNFDYYNVHGNLGVAKSPASDNVLSVDEEIELDCGAYDTYALPITVTPNTVGPWSCDITITDKLVKENPKSLTITIEAEFTRGSQQINWTPSQTTFYTIQAEELNAQLPKLTNRNQETKLTSENTDIVSFSETTASIHKNGTVTLCASHPGTIDYAEADTVKHDFTINITPTTITALPAISGTIYGGTAANDVVLTGGSAKNTVNNEGVGGSFKVISPATLDAGTYDLTIEFKPDNENMYSRSQATLENVTISQITPEASELGVTVGKITYGQSIEEASLTNTGSLAGTWHWVDEAANHATPGAGNCNNLNVYFEPTNTNYATVYSTVSVTVNKATPEVTAQASAITYGQPISASNITTASGDVAGTWAWAVDDTQVLSVGDHVLKANFTSDSANYNNLSNVDVTLKVGKATPTLSWTSHPTDLAYDATDAVYTATSASDGTISYSITSGSEYAEIHATTGALTIIEPGHTITVQATQAEGTNHTAPAAITETVTIAAAPVAPATYTYTGNGNWIEDGKWSTNDAPEDPVDVIVDGNVIISTVVTVSSLTIKDGGSVTLTETGKLTIGDNDSEDFSAYGNLFVQNGGQVILGEGKLYIKDFTLEASLNGLDELSVNKSAKSGQVTNAHKLVRNGNAYFDLTFDPSGKISYGWYNFTVPFSVDINSGISRIHTTDNRVMVSGTDFIVMEADEVNRANGGKGWRVLNSGALQPGKLYTITFNYQPTFDQNDFRFTWNHEGSILNGESYTAQCEAGSVEELRGWNGLGNGMLRHGYLVNNYKMQAYNHQTNTYELVVTNNTFAVGSAFFIQVGDAGDVNWTTVVDANRPLYAPKREAEEVDEFLLSLRGEVSNTADYMYFSASEDATEAYRIGHDLLKMGTPTQATVAQIWATKGGKALCDVEATLLNDEATTPLSLYAPNAGQYTLAVEEMPEDATLYLTYNGEVIWDLTASPYVFDLTKGTTTGYALRISAANAPQITTGVDDIQGGEAQVRKVIIDNKMYIITPEGAIFDAIGKKVQ